MNAFNMQPTDVDAIVLSLLSSADKGKGKTPRKLNAYQIAARFPDAIVRAFVDADRFGGRGAGIAAGQPPLTMIVKDSCKRLAKQGQVNIDYTDTKGLLIEVKFYDNVANENRCVFVRPSFGVCGLYQYIGKQSVRVAI